MDTYTYIYIYMRFWCWILFVFYKSNVSLWGSWVTHAFIFRFFQLQYNCGVFSCVSICILVSAFLILQLDHRYMNWRLVFWALRWGTCLDYWKLFPCSGQSLCMLNSPKEDFSNCPRNLCEVLLLSSCALMYKPCMCNVFIIAGERVKFLPNLFSFLSICAMQRKYISLSPLASFFPFLFSVATCWCKKACIFFALPIILLCNLNCQTTICTLSNQMDVCLENNMITCM